MILKQNISVMKRKSMIRNLTIGVMAVVAVLMAALPASAQSSAIRVVKGRVLSAATRQPLSGVLVGSAEISGYSALTEDDGTYEIRVPDYCTQLVASAPDFNQVHCGLSRSERQPDILLYPATLRADYRGGFHVAGSEQAEGFGRSSAISIEEEVQQQLGAHVHTVTRSGTPGMGSVMFVEGLHSLTSNSQPLIVIDGVVFDQQYDMQMLHSGFFSDLLASINPADIERVTVLRGGASLYGAKGANGVILIETRRNKSMATRITATISAGVTLEPKHLDMMNAEQYRSYASELLKTTNTTVSDFKFLNENPDYYYYNQYHNNTDWKEQVYRTAVTQNYGINVEGGDNVANYNLSLGYTSAQSTLDYNSMNRLNIRFNTDIKFSDKFALRFDASFANLSRNLRDDGAPAGYDEGSPSAPSFLAYAKSPFLSPYAYANGTISSHLDVTDETYLDEALHHYQGYNYKLGNPYALNQYGDAENKNRFDNSMLNVALTPRCQLSPNVSLSEHFSYTLLSLSEKYYIPIYGMPDYYVSSLAATRENEVRSLSAKQNSLMSDTRLQWKQRLNAHHFNAMGGVRINWEDRVLTSQLGYNTGNDKTPFIQNGPNSEADGNSANRVNIAWYAQLQYNLLQRYYAQLNLTAETSSRFGKEADSGLKAFGARWGLFPGVQLAWVLTNEPWLARVRGIDYLRLGVGFDVTGNDDISDLAQRSYFSSSKYLGSILGLSLGSIGNSRLQWERTQRLSASLEGNFMNNRLNLHVQVFSSKTDHLLTLQALSYLTGLDTNWGNGGSLTNSGFDVSLNARLLVRRNWQWELGASMGHYKNKLKSLPNGQQYMDTQLYGATIRSQVGQAVNAFYGYRTLGVFPTSEEAAAANLCQTAANGIDLNQFKAGDVHFDDLDGNGCINEADQLLIGDPNPNIYGNIFSSLCYKRLRLDVGLSYSLGNDVYNYLRAQLEGGQRFMNQTRAMTRRWHGEGHVTDIPQVSFSDPMGNSRFSDRWIEDGSYLKLKSVTLSYQLPVNSQFLQGLEFWLQANNVFTFSRYLGSDPETAITSNVLGQGIDTGLLPQSRSLVAGVKINL